MEEENFFPLKAMPPEQDMDNSHEWEDEEEYEEYEDEDDDWYDEEGEEYNEPIDSPDDARQRILPAWKSQNPLYATFVTAYKESMDVYIDWPCHAPFMVKEGATLVGSNISGANYPEIAPMYWDFISGPDSPWRLLWEGSSIESVKNEDGNLIGFYLDPELAHKHFMVAYNFCIAARMVGERPNTIESWKKIVENDPNMDPADALFLAKMVHFGLGGPEFSSGFNDGAHWPLRTSHLKKMFSFKRFREGNPDVGLCNEEDSWGTPNANIMWITQKYRPAFEYFPYLINYKPGQFLMDNKLDLDKMKAGFKDYVTKADEDYDG